MWTVIVSFSDLKVIKLFSCSTQLSMKFIMLINVKMPTFVVEISCSIELSM